MSCYKGFIVGNLAEAKRNVDLGKWKLAEENAWRALYVVNALEFAICPERKENLMLARLAVEKFKHSISDKEDPSSIAEKYTTALKEVDARAKCA